MDTAKTSETHTYHNSLLLPKNGKETAQSDSNTTWISYCGIHLHLNDFSPSSLSAFWHVYTMFHFSSRERAWIWAHEGKWTACPMISPFLPDITIMLLRSETVARLSLVLLKLQAVTSSLIPSPSRSGKTMGNSKSTALLLSWWLWRCHTILPEKNYKNCLHSLGAMGDIKNANWKLPSSGLLCSSHPLQEESLKSPKNVNCLYIMPVCHLNISKGSQRHQ